MPRRMIDSRIFNNERYGELPLGARQLLSSIVTHADEDGRLKGSGKFLRSITFPYDEEVSTNQTEQWRDLLAKAQFIRTYSKNGDQFLDVPGWTDPKSEFHQILRKDRYTPSLIPSFREADNQPTTSRQPADNQVTDSCPLEGKVSKGKVVNGVSADTPMSPGPVEPGKDTQETAELKVPYKEFVALYQKCCSSVLPSVKELSGERRKKIATRWREHPDWPFWEEFWRRVAGSSFLCGTRPDQTWKASLFWCLNQENFLKILEGHYDNRPEGGTGDTTRGLTAHQRTPTQKRDYDGQVERFRRTH